MATYTVTATNAASASEADVIITVEPPPLTRPDLANVEARVLPMASQANIVYHQQWWWRPHWLHSLPRPAARADGNEQR